jgi:hypothetical protein
MAMSTPNPYTPKINEAINKAIKKNTSPYDQLTNINRGKPNIAPSPTATPMVKQDPNLRKFINQFKKEETMMGKRPPNPFQQQEPIPTRPLSPTSFIPEDIMTPESRNPFQLPMGQDMIRKILANLPPGINPQAVAANPQGYLQQMQEQQRMQQPGIPYYMQEPLQGQQPMQPQAPYMPTVGMPQPLQPQQNIKSLMGQLQGMNTPMQTPQPAGLSSLVPRQVNTSYGGGMGQQPMGTQNTLQYMATYDPSPFSSAQPMGTQNTQLGKMGQPAQNIQPAFGGNMLGQKNAFS